MKHVLEWKGVSEWFSVKVDFRQGCVMSPRLFSLFMDRVMKELKANILQGRVKFGMGENTSEKEVLGRFDHVARMEDNRMAKKLRQVETNDSISQSYPLY